MPTSIRHGSCPEIQKASCKNLWIYWRARLSMCSLKLSLKNLSGLSSIVCSNRKKQRKRWTRTITHFKQRLCWISKRETLHSSKIKGSLFSGEKKIICSLWVSHREISQSPASALQNLGLQPDNIRIREVIRLPVFAINFQLAQTYTVFSLITSINFLIAIDSSPYCSVCPKWATRRIKVSIFYG